MSLLHGRLGRLRVRATHRTTVLLVALLALLVTATGAAASPGTLRLLQVSPSLGHKVAVTAPGGGTYSVNPGRSQVRVTMGGDPLLTWAWCVMPRVGIGSGTDYTVDLQSSQETADLATPAQQEAAWLMTRADGLLAAAADPGREAAAIQVAVWQLTGQAADITAVTADTALNARVAQLRAMAAGRSAGATVTLAGPAAGVVAGVPATVTVTGTPGDVVTLRATGATLSADRVTLAADGTATVTATPTAAGEFSVTAAAPGAVLWRAVHPANRPAQNLSWVVPGTVYGRLVVTAAAAPAEVPVTTTPTTTPTTPVVVPTGTRNATLRLVKSAPRTVVTGLPVRYTLTVRNVSGRVARDVVVRDVLPRGTYVKTTPSRAILRGGAVVWRLGDLAPKATVTVHVTRWTLKASGTVIRNGATATAANAASVRAGAVTRVLPLPPGSQPAVAG
ncbi:MAG: DUF11 domain-containing protein [Thermoleophilia bacterium]|nr:DUF11 domain-containing protein [Thermoleophilia bacterium]